MPDHVDRHWRRRDEWIAKAKAAPSFIDAVVVVAYYNIERRCIGPKPWAQEITVSDVFADYVECHYAECYRRSIDLLTKTAYVGASYWNYENAASYDESIKRMKKENPGFGDDSYKLAAAKSASDMKW
jgi:hypothetical protein